MGLTRNFHGKKGGPDFFFFFFLRSEGEPRKIYAINIFCIRPPLQVFVNGPLDMLEVLAWVTTAC